jgi:hypothetical protein
VELLILKAYALESREEPTIPTARNWYKEVKELLAARRAELESKDDADRILVSRSISGMRH